MGQGFPNRPQDNGAQKMPKMAHILQMIVALSLLFALAISPAYDAVKHGPAAYLSELERVAHHATKDHSHHNMDDHDHTVVVILPAGLAQSVQFAGDVDLPAPDQVSDALTQLPRRPPRA